MGQKAFYFDMKKCAGCHACEVACRDRNALYNVGELFRKVDLYEGGKYPKPWMYFLSIACNHCAKPACIANCPTGALYKDADTGLVLVDDELCIGCGTCVQACPYHEPILMEKEGKTVAAKCDGCYALVKEGKNPVCVDAHRHYESAPGRRAEHQSPAGCHGDDSGVLHRRNSRSSGRGADTSLLICTAGLSGKRV